MQSLDLGGIGGLLLLVLPALAALCVLLTAPVARAIGRSRHEEEQVARAPLLVAGIAVLLQGALALALLRSVRGAEMPVPVGALYFELSPYALSCVFALSAVVLVLLAATELSQQRPGVLATDQLAGVLVAWGAQCCLALAAGMATVVTGVWLVSATTSVLLLLEAFRHARPGKLWLAAWALLIPIIAFLLLRPVGGAELGTDFIDARALLRTGGLRAAEGLLLKLWLAGGLTAVAGLVAFAGIPRVPVSFSPAPVLFAAGALAGTLPALLHLTLSVVPVGSLTDGGLGPPLRSAWVTLGVLVLPFVLYGFSAFRRLCWLCVGCVCSLGWMAAHTGATPSLWAHLGPLAAALALPLCLAAVQALETARVLPSAAPRRLPLSAVVLFPAAVALSGILASLSDPDAQTPAIVLRDTVLAALFVTGAVAVGWLAARARREAVRHGQFSRPGGRLPHLDEFIVLVPWLVLVAMAAWCWSVGLRELPRLLP